MHGCLGRWTLACLKEGYAETYPVFLEELKDLDPDVVLVESASIPCQDAARALRIPIVMTGSPWPDEPWSSLLSRWRDLPFTASSARIPLKALGDLWDTVSRTGWDTVRVMWYRWSKELPLISRRESDVVLMTSFTPLWPNANFAPKVRMIGPVVGPLDKDKEIEPDILMFLEAHKKVALFAFGQFLQSQGDERMMLINALKDAHDQGLIDGVIWGMYTCDGTMPTGRITHLTLSGDISHSGHRSHFIPSRSLMA